MLILSLVLQGHLGPALLHALEGLPLHTLGLPSLLSDPGSRTTEEALVHTFVEARRASPAVLYLPHFDGWWRTAGESLRACLTQMISDLPPGLPLLFLATADEAATELDPDICDLFG